MRLLRNKKTGEIASYKEILTDEFINDLFSKDFDYFHSKLCKIIDEWEDYEEPEVYYYISDFGAIRECKIGRYPEDEEDRKLIGNYFETKEEVEKAVEKLKAWKRLKDNGLTFCAWKITDDGCSVDVETTLDAEIVRAKQKYITDDLNLIFGNEE